MVVAMVTNNRQPKWDIFEAAILLEAVLNVDAKTESKKDAIKRVSSTLRRMAINKGRNIDGTFRNLNGITFQFQSMEFSLYGKQNSIHKTGSKVFDEVVALYRDDPMEYNRILATAHANVNVDMKSDNHNANYTSVCIYDQRNSFRDWLIFEGRKEIQANWIIERFEQVSQYAIEKKIIKEELMNISNIKTWNDAVKAIQSYKFFRVFNRDLYKFFQSYSKIYASFLKKNESMKGLISNDKYEFSKDAYIVTDIDEVLFKQFGEKVGKVYSVLAQNNRHVYLTSEQISSITSIDPSSIAVILDKSSWAEKFGDGYILGHNNLSKSSAIFFDISEAFSAPSKTESVLKESFRRGFRPDSIMDKNRFIALYKDKYDEIISDYDIIEEVKKSCFKFDNRFFLPKALVDKDTAQEIARYISEYFSQKDILFYNVLYETFEEKFESFIYSSEMLVAFLQKVLVCATIYYSDRFCSIKANATPDISSEIIDYLIKMDIPCSYNVIYEHFSYLNQRDIYNVIHYNNPEILGNSKVEYFHVKTAHLSLSEIDELKNTTRALLTNSKFITCNEIMDSLNQSNHDLMERLNSKYSPLGVRRIFTYYLRSNYDVETGIVTRKGMKMTVIDAFADFAQTHKNFTVDDVQAFAEYTGTVPYWDTIHKYAVRVNATEFVSDEDVDFDVEAIDSAIEYYCNDYIALREISDYSRFPSCGVTWNIYLLQQYVFRFSKQFKLVSLGFTKGSASGAIVRKQCGFDDFDSVIIDVLEKTNITSPNDAIQYLCNKGFIVEKRYKKHANLLKVAVARRNNS